MSHLIPIIIISAVLVGIAALYWIPKLQVRGLPVHSDARFDKENEARKTLAQIIGGLAVIFTLYQTTESINLTRESINALKGQLAISQQQLRLSESGELTDRFIKAVAQLGNENASVRVGGISSLDRLAVDSPRDYWAAMTTLASFVNVRTGGLLLSHKPLTPFRTHIVGFGLAEDVQAAVATIGGRRGADDPDEVLAMTDCDLRGASLQQPILEMFGSMALTWRMPISGEQPSTPIPPYKRAMWRERILVMPKDLLRMK